MNVALVSRFVHVHGVKELPNRSFQRGWNAAIDAALQVTRAFENDGHSRSLQRAIRELLFPSYPRAFSISALARKYAISRRTVLYWKKEGCPFDKGQRAVLDWMASRRYLPAGAAKKFRKQIQKRKLRASLVALDAQAMEVHAIARLHRRLGLPVEPWMKLPRLTRRKVRSVVERLEKEVLQEARDQEQ